MNPMDQVDRSFGGMVRLTAFVPMAMSLIALAVVLLHIAIYGVAREADEGTAAHIWQLLMAGQHPVLAFFAIKWLPHAPDWRCTCWCCKPEPRWRLWHRYFS